MNIGGYCRCRSTNSFEIWQADLTVASDTSEPHLRSGSVADVCRQCHKPIRKQEFILQRCDSTTIDRFPEE